MATGASVDGAGSATAVADHHHHSQTEHTVTREQSIESGKRQNAEKNNRFPETPQEVIEWQQEVPRARAQERRRPHSPPQNGASRSTTLQAPQLGDAIPPPHRHWAGHQTVNQRAKTEPRGTANANQGVMNCAKFNF